MSDTPQNQDYEQSAQPDINAPEFENGKNVRKAISNANQALQIARRLEKDDWERDRRRARVLGAFNGEAPYDDRELEAKAQAYRYNVSFGFMEGVIGRAIVPYNELSSNVDNLAEADAELDDKKLSIFRDEFVEAIKGWGKWPKFVSRLNQELVLNGWCTACFPSYYNPWPRFVPQKDGFVNEGSSNDVADLELFVMRRTYLIHELYENIEDADVAKKAGWNVENVRDVLQNATPKNIWNQGTNTSGAWTAVESAIRGGALFSSIVGAKVIETYHVFAAELDGKVTHYIVANTTEQTGDQPGNEKMELFKKEGRFPSMREFMVYFDLEAGDGSWHGSRGLGQRSFNTHKAIDKLRNSVLDQAFVSGLLILQPGDQASQEDFSLSVVGPFAVIPAGITVGSTALPTLSTQTFQADALLAATSEQRVGDVVPQTPNVQTGERQTATEARISAGRQALISKGNLQRYLDPLSQLLSIMVRRLLMKETQNDAAKKFQARLRERGFTDEDLKKIRGARSTGRIDDVLGDTKVNTQIAFAEFRGDPDIDQVELKRKRLGSILGERAVEELLIAETDKGKQIEAAREQALEISAMIEGIPIPASPRDMHEIHIAIGMQWLGGQIQMLQQGRKGEDPISLNEVVQHIAQHIAFLEQNKAKKGVAQQAGEQLKAAIAELQKGVQQAAPPVETVPPQEVAA